MDEKYYKPISKDLYENFKIKYTENILTQIKQKSGKDYELAHFAAGLLVNELKDPEDTFTNFVPPKEAKEYSKTIYGYENGIGIKGHLDNGAYIIDHVEIRSNAYQLGIEVGDLLLEINKTSVKKLTDEQIHNLLYPPIDTKVKIKISHIATKKTKTYIIKCTEYFEETLENIPTDMAGVYYLKIKKFNRMTGEDFKKYMEQHSTDSIQYLVIDLTDNPGGAPLAVQELCGILLPTKKNLFYYKKKNISEFGLKSPDSNIKYKNKLLIVVNKKSGSASELFAGTMKAYHRAIVLGKESTAGLAQLKGVSNFPDGSMIAMITGRAYIFDGTELGKDGVKPNYQIPEDVKDIEKFVLKQIQTKIYSDSK
jgi:carboxyl-terminal processing protease